MKILLSIFLLFGSFSSFASDNKSGWWTGTFSTKSLTKSLKATMEVQIRNSFDSGEIKQQLYRAGVLYKAKENSPHTFGFLYGVIQSGSTTERRYTLQHTMNYLHQGKSKLGHRVRFEGRDFSRVSNDSMRFRYLLKYTHQFSSFSGIISNEVFVNVTDEKDRGQDPIERNRIFLGVRFPFFKTHLEVGYLNQMTFRKAQDTREHLAVVYWFF